MPVPPPHPAPPGRVRQCLRALVGMAALAAAPAAAPPDAATLVRHEVLMLQLLGGGTSLSEAERQQATHIVALAMQAAPQAWLGFDARDAGILQRVANHDDADVAAMQETARLAAETGVAQIPALQQVATLEDAILRAHDPTIAYDPAARLLLTERGLEALRAGAAFLAPRAGLAPPGPDFIAAARARLGHGLSAEERSVANAIGHVRSKAPSLAGGFARMPAAQQQRAIEIARSYVGDAQGQDAAWRLALAAAQLAVVVRRSEGAAGLAGSLMERTMLGNLTQRQMQQNVWSLRHPECGVVGSHPSSCSRAPIFQPIQPY